jgi:hypothetical protein
MDDVSAASSGRSIERVSIRLLQLLDSVELAGFAPMSFRAVHSYAYLANLLGKLWDVDPLDGKILKAGAPYYPEVRVALDRTILLGLVDLTEYSAVEIEPGTWTGEGLVGLNTECARPILSRLDIFESERQVRSFLTSLAFAIAPYANELVEIVSTDVTWTDKRVGKGDVLDFAESRDANYTANAANAFADVLPAGMKPTQGEKLQYYVELLERRQVEAREAGRRVA